MNSLAKALTHRGKHFCPKYIPGRSYHQHQTFWSQFDLNISEFKQVCSEETDPQHYPFSQTISSNIVIYDGTEIQSALDQSDTKFQLGFRDEIVRCLRDGPGVFIIKKAYRDLRVIEQVTKIFRSQIAHEKKLGIGGDHFASNERLWNSLEKLCMADPQIFLEYYGSQILAFVSRAWLGPFYQLTAQVNNIHPGGKAQNPHRDYHLGFQPANIVAQFPSHAQIASQFLTLQGAIAHSDVLLESGPTRFLPFSQKYPAGYLAYTFPEYSEYFQENYVALPLDKGDMVCFNPGLHHAGGENKTQTDRLVDLFQISSGMGRCMETVNRSSMIRHAYPVLLEGVKSGKFVIDSQPLHDALVAAGESYAFPSNLDIHAP